MSSPLLHESRWSLSLLSEARIKCLLSFSLRSSQIIRTQNKQTTSMYQRRKKRLVFFSLWFCVRACLCSFKARLFSSEDDDDSFVSNLSFFSLLCAFERKEKENLVSKSRLLLKKHHLATVFSAAKDREIFSFFFFFLSFFHARE